jgi:hypothetical protein
MPMPGSPPGRYWALYHAVVNERGRRQRNAMTAGMLAGLLAVFAYGASPLVDASSNDLVPGFLLFLGVQAVVLALALLRLTGGDYRKALMVGELARRASYASWKEATGEDVPPLSPEDAAGWLARHPEADRLLPQRLHALINVGDRDGAHATLARYPLDTAAERYSHASDAWFLAFLDGSDAEPVQVEALATELDDAEARARAQVSLATLRANLAAARGGDWITPMAAAYPAVEGRITDDWRAANVLRPWTMTMAVSSVIVGVAYLAWRWLVPGFWPPVR